MKRIAQIYTSENKFLELLSENNVNYNDECLVRIFTAELGEEASVKLAKIIKRILPNATIIGATASQTVVFECEQYDSSTLIMVDFYQKLKIRHQIISFDGKMPFEVASEIHNEYAKTSQNQLVHILFSDRYRDVHQFVDEINLLKPRLKLVGGIAGDLTPVGETEEVLAFLFNENGYYHKSVVNFSLEGSLQYNFISTNTSQSVISEEHKVTKAKDGFIYEPALDWVYNYLNLTEIDKNEFNDWNTRVKQDYLVHFPMILEDENKVARYTRYDSETNNLAFYFSKIDEEFDFKVGYLNPEHTIDETYRLCVDILSTPVEHLFVYSCLFRRLYLNNCSKWELSPFAKYNVCGIFLLGEISNVNGKNLFHNGASCFVGVAEEEHYLIPDTLALDDTNQIFEDADFLQKSNEKQTQNAEIIGKLKNAKVQKNIDFLDDCFNISNIHKYEIDYKNSDFDKLITIEITTADATIAFAGQQKYQESCREFIANCRNFLNSNGYDSFNAIYSFNYKTILIPAKKCVPTDIFIKCARELKENFGYLNSRVTGLSAVCHFAVVVNQSDLVEIGLNALFQNRKSHDNFIICDQDIRDNNATIEEIKALELIKKAIDQKLITPFYQGIMNNETGKIDKFEALMRVVDIDGKIYPPFVFLDVSKKYKLYQEISIMLIDKVFNDFENREEMFSFNISSYDIVSSKFRRWIIDRIKGFKSPERVIVEFVETEDFKEIDVLFEFTEQIHKCGSKIAIDDFGSGYSTFATIVALKPDYIKVDGSIIKDIDTNVDNQIILDTISYLASQLKTETVAEFVENAKIQNVMKTRQINHSQGYYFAKPLPIKDIDSIVLPQN